MSSAICLANSSSLLVFIASTIITAASSSVNPSCAFYRSGVTLDPLAIIAPAPTVIFIPFSGALFLLAAITLRFKSVFTPVFAATAFFSGTAVVVSVGNPAGFANFLVMARLLR